MAETETPPADPAPAVEAPAPAPGRLAHWAPLASLATLVVAIDQTVKWLVRDRIAYGDEATVLGVRLHHTRNDGLLGGHVSGAALPVGILTVIGIVVALVVYARRSDLSLAARVAFGLLLGGAVGNLADRLRLGYVTDLIARGDRNAFNLADLAIYVGLGLTMLLVLLSDRRRSRAARLRPPPAPDGGT